MKSFRSVSFVILFLGVVSCDVPGTLVGIPRFASRTPPTCLNSFLPICGDCKTLWKCQNVDPSPTVTCKTAYPDRPYCSKGACTSEAPSECQATFRCTDAGYFPNPLNCSRYHLCAVAGAVGTSVATYECPEGFVYNPATTMCKQLRTKADCAVFDCSTDPYGYFVYPADSRFFASCSPDEEPLVLRCATYHVYKPSDRICVFQCPREGRIAYPFSLTKYYECYLLGTTYFYRQLECVTGYQFDENAQQCRPVSVG